MRQEPGKPCVCAAGPSATGGAEASVCKGCAVARNVGDVLAKATIRNRVTATEHCEMVPGAQGPMLKIL